MTLTLAQIRRRYVVDGRPLDAAMEAALKADPRNGAKAILEAVARRRFENRSEGQRLRTLLRQRRICGTPACSTLLALMKQA